MLDTTRAFIVGNPLIATALSALYGAILIDLVAFVGSKAPGDFFAQFNWATAGWRYVQGFVGGLIGTTIVTPAVAGGAALVTLWLFW